MWVLLHYLHALSVSQKQGATNQMQGCLTPSSNLNQRRQRTVELACLLCLPRNSCTTSLYSCAVGAIENLCFPPADDAPGQRKHLHLLCLSFSILNQMLPLFTRHPLCAALLSAVSGGLRQNF